MSKWISTAGYWGDNTDSDDLKHVVINSDHVLFIEKTKNGIARLAFSDYEGYNNFLTSESYDYILRQLAE